MKELMFNLARKEKVQGKTALRKLWIYKEIYQEKWFKNGGSAHRDLKEMQVKKGNSKSKVKTGILTLIQLTIRKKEHCTIPGLSKLSVIQEFPKDLN